MSPHNNSKYQNLGILSFRSCHSLLGSMCGLLVQVHTFLLVYIQLSTAMGGFHEAALSPERVRYSACLYTNPRVCVIINYYKLCYHIILKYRNIT